MTTSTVRLGLIGAGRWGRNIIKTIRAQNNARLVRVASGNPATKGLVGPECVIDGDWRALISSGQVDGVLIATPPSLHVQIAMSAVEAGIAVMVEKPLALTSQAARTLLERARDLGGTVMVDHTHLFHPAWHEVKRWATPIENIVEIHSVGGGRGPFRSDLTPLWDWGPHDIAMCLDLMGEAPKQVRATVVHDEQDCRAVAQVVRVELEFSRAKAILNVGNAMAERARRFEVQLDDRNVVYDDVGPNKLVIDGVVSPVATKLPLTAAIDELIVAIIQRRRDLAELELAVQVVETLERSARALDDGIPH